MRATPKARLIPRSTITYIATIGCIALFLSLSAATIVLGLIPLYLNNDSVSVNPNALRSKEVTMTVEIEENDSVSGGRRRRDAGDLYDYIDGVFGEAGIVQVKNKLLATLPSNIVRSISMSSVSIGYQAISKRRRFALSKRATFPNHPIVVVIKFYIIFNPICLYKCQLNNGPILRSRLYGISLSTFIFTNVPIFKNGRFYKYAPRIRFVGIVYVSFIFPGLGPVTPSVPAVTATLTSVTTRTSTTSRRTTPAIIG